MVGLRTVLPRPVADRLMSGELGVQSSVGPVGVGVHGGLDREVLLERGLEFSAGDVGHQIDVDDAVGLLVDAEDRVLEVLGSPSMLDLSGLPKLCSAVLKARPKVGLIDLDLPVEQSDGLVLERPDCTPELEEEAMDPMVGRLHPPGDVMVGQPELEPEEQLVDLQQGEPGASEPGAAERQTASHTAYNTPSGRRRVARACACSRTRYTGADPRTELHARWPELVCH